MTEVNPFTGIFQPFSDETETEMPKELFMEEFEMNLTTASPETSIGELENSINTFFILINSFIVFFLQGGFAFLEAGSVRAKNTTNILIKNILDCLVGALAFWVCGYMIANSDGNAFMGYDSNFMLLVGVDASHFAQWFFGFVFCATASTIVSGAVAERCELTAYFVYSTVISALVYPVVVHWAWTPGGWLAINGYYDFAGSGVVHHLGGVCALMGAVFLGPRIGRFDDNNTHNIPGHSVSLAALGAFILMFGFFSFNGATNGAVASVEDRNIVQRAVINTIIGGMSGGLITLLVFRLTDNKKWSLLMTINGTLTGMIATCAFCNAAETWATFIVGIFAAMMYVLVHYSLIWFRVDDPLDAVAVHSGGGVVGVMAAPFVISEGGIWDADSGVTAMHQIWSQLVGLLVITAWSAGVSSVIFFILKMNNKLRLPREVEIAGCDVIKHGEAAYPEEVDKRQTTEAIVTRDGEDTQNMAWTELNVRPWGSWKKRSMKTKVIKETSFPVTSLKFRKLREKTERDNSGSSSSGSNPENVQNHVLPGVINNAFNDSDLFEKSQEIINGPLKNLIVAEDRALDFNNSKESTVI